MKTSFIATTYNEELTVGLLLNSLLSQTKLPDEVIIVDGGSKDDTISNVKFQMSNFKRKGINLKTFVKSGNRAVGRNEAIKQATGEIILCSDAGCILKKDWVEKILEPFEKIGYTSIKGALKRPHPSRLKAVSSLFFQERVIRKKILVDVVAGYYQGKAETVFQKCLIPYVLVMPDKVNPQTFLPASRSMAFTRAIWEKTGGFPENLSHNEDYAFARSLKKIGAKTVFRKDAIVYWIPRKTAKEAFVMFYRFAYGDAQAGIFRPKVLLLLFRYLLAVVLTFAFILTQSYLILDTLYLILLLYILWSIMKNYKYVRDIRASFYLPLLQLIADGAVILGTLGGLLSSIFHSTAKTEYRISKSEANSNNQES